MVPHIAAELSAIICVETNDLFGCNFGFKVRLLNADLGAKCHMFNMLKFNGFYGCHFFIAKGKTIGRTHAYYPYTDNATIREPSLNDFYIDLAETLRMNRVPNAVGVKGKSAFEDLIKGLPLSAPIDYMHCVLIGVFPDLLKLCYKALSAKDKLVVNKVTAQLACPREMVSYSRKIRSLDEISQFKTNEYFNWLFYINPILFLNRLPSKTYSHLTNLSYGVRLLLESNAKENVLQSEKLLDQFCRHIVAVHGGNDKIETINVHCIKHLTDQVRRFGPSFCETAMSFESANRSLGEVFTGTNSECEVICRRILQRHHLTNLKVQNSEFKQVFGKLTEKLDAEYATFNDKFVETEAVKIGRRKNKSGKFLNRLIFNSCYFDSPAYKRSKCGNCYVFFREQNQ